MFHKIVQKIPFLLVGLSRVLNNGAGFLITLILVRFAGITGDDLGYAQNALALFTIISLVSDFGMVETLQYEENTHNPKDIIFTSISVLLGVKSIIGLVIVILNSFTGFLNMDTPSLFGILIAFTIFNTLVLVYNGLLKPLKSSIFLIIYVCTLLASIIGLSLFVSSSSDIVIGGYLIASVVAVVIICVNLYKDDLLNWKFVSLDAAYLKMCASNTLFWISFVILTQTDILFINQLYSATDAGYYKSSAQIALFIRVAGLLVTTPLLPFISQKMQLQNGKEIVKPLLVKLIDGIFLCVFALSAGAFFFGNELLQLVFGNDDIASFGSQYLYLFLLVFGSQTAQMVMTAFWQGTGKAKTISIISFVQVVLYCIVALPLLLLGITQFLCGLLLVELCCWSLQMWYFKRV